MAYPNYPERGGRGGGRGGRGGGRGGRGGYEGGRGGGRGGYEGGRGGYEGRGGGRGGYDGGRGGRGGGRGGRGGGRGGGTFLQARGPIDVVANHFKLDISNKAPKFYRYRVSVERWGETEEIWKTKQENGRNVENPLKREIRQKVLNAFLNETCGKSLGNPADGLAFDEDHILLSIDKLHTSADDKPTELGRSQFKVLLDPEGEFDLKDLKKADTRIEDNSAQHLDILVRAAALAGHEHVGRGRFMPLDVQPRALREFDKCPKKDATCNGRFLWMGHVQKTALTKLTNGNNATYNWTLNVNAASQACIPDISLIGYIEDKQNQPIQKVDFGRDVIVANLNKDLGNAIITLHHYRDNGAPSKRTKTMIRIDGKKTANSYRFPHNEKEVTLVAYFKQAYNIQLKHPDLPLVQVKPEKNQTFFPMELVTLARQKMQRRVEEGVKSVIGSIMTMDPGDRKDYVEKHVVELIERNQVLDKFGIQINKNMLEVGAVVLPPPTLHYSNRITNLGTGTTKGGRVDFPIDKPGSWNLQNVCFNECHATQHLGLIDFGSLLSPDTKMEFMRRMCEEAKRYNLRLNDGKPPILMGLDHRLMGSNFDEFKKKFRENFHKQFENAKSQGVNVKLVFCLIDTKDVALYQLIKEVIDPKCPSQCLVKRNTPLLNGQDRGIAGHYANILMKVNQKLGGANQTISPNSEKKIFREVMGTDNSVMLLGVDMTHPSVAFGRSKIAPSLVALVGCRDVDGAHYEHSVISQQATIETVQNLASMVTDVITKSCKTYKDWPKTVIYIRDGVSDGQMDTVSNMELAQLLKAYSDAGKPSPKVVMLVVQKHHQTRLFPKASQGRADPRMNLPPGTLLKDNLTNPSKFPNFYLISQAGIKGTSNPARYFILQDDTNSTEEKWAQFLYHLCHTYGRATKSVSLPAPVYYAHLLADRARFLAATTVQDETGLKILGSDTSSVTASAQQGRQADIDTDAVQSAVNKKLKQITDNCRPMFYM